MDETWKQILTFAGTVGGVAFMTLIGNGVKKLWTGAASRERIRTTSLVRRTDTAEKKMEKAQDEMEAERELRLKAEYHVSLLQRQVISLGGKPVKNDHDEE
jgi:hypothetical protein